MRTGESVADGTGRGFAVGEMIGRGLWGTSWAVRDANGRDLVLKVAYGATDFAGGVPDEIVALSRAAAAEQAALLRSGKPWLPKLESEVDVAGSPALLIQRLPSNLRRKMSTGMLMSESIELVRAVAKLLGEAGVHHGNLRPSNILLDDRGSPVLADLLTPSSAKLRSKILAVVPDRDDWHPATLQSAAGEADARALEAFDTWALCLLVWRASIASIPQRDGSRREEKVALPQSGLDKIEVAALRDRVLARLKEDRANPRFAPRLAERLGKMLNRGLSAEAEPSPPYRFHQIAELRERLDEVASLLDPRVENVGHLLLASNAKAGVFQGGEAASFSVTIQCSPGVSGHEDVACGLQILDLDAPVGPEQRVHVPDTRYGCKPHPSGRLRFDFTVPALPPGRYRAKVGFTIKDAQEEPIVAQGDFEIRPPAGYVPPAEDPPTGPVPIQMPRKGPTPATADFTSDGPGSDASDPGSGPGAEIFPLPLAPATRAEPPPRAAAAVAEIELTVQDSDPGSDASEATPPPALQLRPALANSPTIAPADADSHPDVVGVVSSGMPTSPNAGPRPSERPTHPGSPSGPGLGSNPGIAASDPASGPGWSPPRSVDLDDDRPAANEPFLPGGADGADLPSIGGTDRPPVGNPITDTFERLVEIVRRDTYTAFMLIVGAALVLLVFVFAGLKACST